MEFSPCHLQGLSHSHHSQWCGCLFLCLFSFEQCCTCAVVKDRNCSTTHKFNKVNTESVWVQGKLLSHSIWDVPDFEEFILNCVFIVHQLTLHVNGGGFPGGGCILTLSEWFWMLTPLTVVRYVKLCSEHAYKCVYFAYEDLHNSHED